MYKTLTGYLRENSDGTFFVDCTDGSYPAVTFPTKEQAERVPKNRLIVLSIVPDSGRVTSKVPCFAVLEKGDD